MTIADPTSAAEHTFDRAAMKAVKDLQRACASLVAALPFDVRRAVDLERSLSLDKKLAWQVFKLVSAPEPLSEAANIPAPKSMRRFLSAAAGAKVRTSTITRVADAFGKFERFVSDHGGDRFEFVSTVRGLGHEADERSELNIRKSLFRGQAHVWGVQVGTLIRSIVFHPQPDDQPGTMDSVLVRGDVGLRRLRRSAPLTLRAFLRPVDDGPNDPRNVQRDPQQPVPPVLRAPQPLEVDELKVLREFSTDPLPTMLPTKNPDGSVRTELVFPPAGRKGAITLYTAQRAVVRWVGARPLYALNILVREPTEVLVSEILVPVGYSDPGTARVAIYGSRGAVLDAFQCRPQDLLPQHETITHAGPLDTSPPIFGSSDHSAAVEAVVRQASWQGTLFDVYRCTVRYPVLHTAVNIAVDAAPFVRRA